MVTAATNELSPGRGELVQLDPATLQPLRTTMLDDLPGEVVVDGDTAWVVTTAQVAHRKVVAVDVGTGRVRGETTLPGTIRPGRQENAMLAAGAAGLWLTVPDNATHDHHAVRLDSARAAVMSTIPLPAAPAGIAVGRSVWVGLDDGRLLRIDPVANAVLAEVSLGESILDVAIDGDSVWASVRTSGPEVELMRVDAGSGAVTLRSGVPVSVVAAAHGEVWVANYGFPAPAFTGYVAEFDGATNRLGRSTSIPTVMGNGVSSLAIGEGAVWILAGSTGTLSGLRTAP